MIRPLLIVATLFLGVVGFGQSANTTLLPDQNPNYLLSQEKYTKFRDSLLVSSNTTIQDTYKAYDWYQAREERRMNRRQARWDRNRFGNGWNVGWNNGFNNGWNNWGWNNGWNSWNNNWGWNGGWGFRPSIGFRTGNWWFGF